MLKKNELPDCPVATVLQIIGNKWKIYILQKLFERPHRFNELLKNILGISHRVLAENLRQLETDGIILRKVTGDKQPQKVEYFLSELGEKLRPLIFEIQDFGIFYLQQKNFTTSAN